MPVSNSHRLGTSRRLLDPEPSIKEGYTGLPLYSDRSAADIFMIQALLDSCIVPEHRHWLKLPDFEPVSHE
jgi:hypothetical protein